MELCIVSTGEEDSQHPHFAALSLSVLVLITFNEPFKLLFWHSSVPLLLFHPLAFVFHPRPAPPPCPLLSWHPNSLCVLIPDNLFAASSAPLQLQSVRHSDWERVEQVKHLFLDSLLIFEFQESKFHLMETWADAWYYYKVHHKTDVTNGPWTESDSVKPSERNYENKL